jgi:hypothetical protein
VSNSKLLEKANGPRGSGALEEYGDRSGKTRIRKIRNVGKRERK